MKNGIISFLPLANNLYSYTVCMSFLLYILFPDIHSNFKDKTYRSNIMFMTSSFRWNNF